VFSIIVVDNASSFRLQWVSKVEEVVMPICRMCHGEFKNWIEIDGVKRNLCNRKYCLECSPWGIKNRFILESQPRWNRQDVESAVKKSESLAGALRFLGLVGKGGNYRTLKRAIREYSLDASHWLGKSHLRGKTRIFPQVDLSFVLVENCEYSRSSLKRRLLSDGLLKNECALCGQLPYWMGKPLVLILDHINGVNNDNRIENLRMLCPHCNSQQDTFCGRKNKGVRKTVMWVCKDCGKPVSKSADWCLSCSRKRSRKVERPLLESLLKDLETMTKEAIGRKYGVTGNAVKKWIRQAQETVV